MSMTNCSSHSSYPGITDCLTAQDPIVIYISLQDCVYKTMCPAASPHLHLRLVKNLAHKDLRYHDKRTA